MWIRVKWKSVTYMVRSDNWNKNLISTLHWSVNSLRIQTRRKVFNSSQTKLYNTKIFYNSCCTSVSLGCLRSVLTLNVTSQECQLFNLIPNSKHIYMFWGMINSLSYAVSHHEPLSCIQLISIAYKCWL